MEFGICRVSWQFVRLSGTCHVLHLTGRLFDIRGGLTLVFGYLGFHTWDFRLCGAASLILGDAARLGVSGHRCMSDKRYDPGTQRNGA